MMNKDVYKGLFRLNVIFTCSEIIWVPFIVILLHHLLKDECHYKVNAFDSYTV